MKREKSALLFVILMPIVYVILGIVLVAVLVTNGEYPQGSDTMLHLYKGDLVYRSVAKGDLFPLYDGSWYNGMEPFRNYAPLPAYLLAFVRFLSGGDIMNGYLVFVFLLFFVGAMEWLYIGKKLERPYLGALVGILYFFLPYPLFVLFQEGNLARSLCGVFLPAYVYALYRYAESGKKKAMVAVALLTVVMALCHVGFTGLITLAGVCYLIADSFWNSRWKRLLSLLPVMALSFGVIGIWLVPYLRGGAAAWDYSENMKAFFQSPLISLNPMERQMSGNAHGYFGLSVFLLAVLGIVFSEKKAKGAFFNAVVILFLSSTTAGLVIGALPGGTLIFIMWLFPAALALIFLAFLQWKRMRRILALVFCIGIVLDAVFSLPLIQGVGNHASLEERLSDEWEGTLIAKAQELTKQRMALIDGGYLESMGAYLVSDYGNPVRTSGGYGWRNAVTANNVAQLDRAAAGGSYLYLFDRCKELGNDTVLIRTDFLDLDAAPVEALDAAAKRLGYECITVSPAYRLYHLDVNPRIRGGWGTVNTYEAIGIGTAAGGIAINFPALEETTSTNLNDYTFEELSKYKLVYLAGFTFEDRDSAEELVMRLSEAGVRVVIAADGIPEDRKSHDQSFLGVVCNSIHFTNGFPEFDTIDGRIDPDLFPEGHYDWQTVYLEGLDECWASLYDNDVNLKFYGTVKNDNIVMIGLNLTYFYGITKDEAVGGLLSHALNITGEDIPKRKIVPVEIEENGNYITIKSSSRQVNTALAYVPQFFTDDRAREKNHLLIVGGETTEITIIYPNYRWGAGVSILSVLLLCIYFLWMRKKM